MKKYSFYFFISLCIIFPASTHAAFFEFDPQDSSLGVDNTVFKIGLLISSNEPVNTFDVTLHIPLSLSLVDISDGNSVINLWIKRPILDQTTHTLSFSGITPGGFVGKRGQLLILKFKALTQAQAIITVDHTQTVVYAHNEHPYPVLITSEDISLPAVYGKENININIPDTIPPQIFTPEILSDPNLFDGDNTLVFSTTDKDSGITYYEVKESIFGNLFPNIGWHTAESPYRLSDQTGLSHVFVRAVDEKNNTTTVALTYSYPLFLYGFIILFCIISLITFLHVFFQKIFNRKY
jgi:hypothetical protein